ncbi:MAG: hypothetical protein Q8P18_29150 [Pseudomonadota bacterium]|nr:hypothetical protein [Pseudomonadota bacterium]
MLASLPVLSLSSAPPDTASASARPDALPLPSPLALARGLLGYALLGAVAALGTDPAAASQAPVGLVSAVGALALTVPALLVAHPFLTLRAAPQALVAAIARPFSRTGDLALGLVPTLLLFRATSGLAQLLLALMLVSAAALGFSLAIRNLVAAESGASPDSWSVWKMTLLAWGWSGLAALIGARLGIGVLWGV